MKYMIIESFVAEGRDLLCHHRDKRNDDNGEVLSGGILSFRTVWLQFP